MPTDFPTLLDAYQSASAPTANVLEQVQDYAPEVMLFPAQTVMGTSYEQSVRIDRPTVSFRDANSGVENQKSQYEQRKVWMRYIDTPIETDVAVARAHPRGESAFLATEELGAAAGVVTGLGRQLFYGVSSGAATASKGFVGLRDLYDPTFSVNAGGTGGTSAWLVYADIDNGISWMLDEQNVPTLSSWTKARIQDPSSTKKSFEAWTARLQGYQGVCQINKYAAARIYNLDATHKLTDSLGAQLLEKLPTGARFSFWVMNRTAKRYLRESRSSQGYQASDAKGQGGYSPDPVELEGFNIITSDSIVNGETA